MSHSYSCSCRGVRRRRDCINIADLNQAKVVGLGIGRKVEIMGDDLNGLSSLRCGAAKPEVETELFPPPATGEVVLIGVGTVEVFVDHGFHGKVNGLSHHPDIGPVRCHVPPRILEIDLAMA